jgi:hypothetical protein
LRIKAFGFRHSNIFLEPGIGEQFFSNKFTAVYTGGFEFQLPGTLSSSSFYKSISAGIRTYINPEFYLEISAQYLHRNDQNNAGRKVKANDYQLGIGSGLRF